MNEQLSDQYIASCMIAKKTLRFLPEPAEGLQRRHTFIIKICYELMMNQGEVRVTDVADAIGVTLPSITKNIAALEKKGYLKKEVNAEDKRVVNVLLTEQGLDLYQREVRDFHQKNSQLLQEIPEADIHTTIHTIKKIYQLMAQEYKQD